MKTVLTLFFRSNNKKILYVLITMFFLITFAFYSVFLMISSIQSYKNFLIKSYVGNLGTVYFYAPDMNKEFIKLLKNRYKNKIVFFTKKKPVIKIDSVSKQLDLYIWDGPDMINNVLYFEFPRKKITLEHNSKKISLDFKKFESGFFNNRPIMFLNRKDAWKLGFSVKMDYFSIKTPVERNIIKECVNGVLKLNRYNISIRYETIFDKYSKILDILNSSKSLMFKLVLCLIILVFLIIFFIELVLYVVKIKSLRILHVFGVSVFALSFVFSAVFFFYVFLSIISGFVMFLILKKSFLIFSFKGIFYYLLAILILLSFFIFVYLNIRLRRKV